LFSISSLALAGVVAGPGCGGPGPAALSVGVDIFRGGVPVSGGRREAVGVWSGCFSLIFSLPVALPLCCGCGRSAASVLAGEGQPDFLRWSFPVVCELGLGVSQICCKRWVDSLSCRQWWASRKILSPPVSSLAGASLAGFFRSQVFFLGLVFRFSSFQLQ